MLGDGGQTEPFHAEQSRGDLGVEQPLRLQSKVIESWQILQRIMQNPYRIAYRSIELVPINTFGSQCLRVKQSYAGTVPFELHQPIVMTVSETGCSLRIGSKRPV